MAAIFYQQRILQCLQCFDFSNGLIRTESLILNVVQGLNLLNTFLPFSFEENSCMSSILGFKFLLNKLLIKIKVI